MCCAKKPMEWSKRTQRSLNSDNIVEVVWLKVTIPEHPMSKELIAVNKFQWTWESYFHEELFVIND